MITIVTSSLLLAHTPLLIVHLKTYVTPADPLKLVVGLLANTKLPPAPDTIVHRPVPVTGTLPPKVAGMPPVIQTVWSAPAVAIVGLCCKLMSTSSLLAIHTPLLMVHRKVYVTPAVPLNTVVALFAFTKLPPAPATTLHVPVPTTAALPANVALVPHIAVTPV